MWLCKKTYQNWVMSMLMICALYWAILARSWALLSAKTYERLMKRSSAVYLAVTALKISSVAVVMYESRSPS